MKIVYIWSNTPDRNLENSLFVTFPSALSVNPPSSSGTRGSSSNPVYNRSGPRRIRLRVRVPPQFTSKERRDNNFGDKLGVLRRGRAEILAHPRKNRFVAVTIHHPSTTRRRDVKIRGFDDPTTSRPTRSPTEWITEPNHEHARSVLRTTSYR